MNSNALAPAGNAAPRLRLNTDTNFLKLVAVVTMTIDHVGLVLMDNNLVMRSIGRMAFPIFAYCIVVGCLYTHDILAYIKRMAIFYFVSQPIYVLAFNRNWTQHNIYFTLLLGLVAIWSLRDKQYWAFPLTLMVAYFVSPNYGMNGVYVIILFYMVRNSRALAAVVMCAFCVYWGMNSTVLFYIGPFAVKLQMLAMLSVPLIVLPTNVHPKLNKYVFYAFYPAHLFIIWLISLAIKTVH